MNSACKSAYKQDESEENDCPEYFQNYIDSNQHSFLQSSDDNELVQQQIVGDNQDVHIDLQRNPMNERLLRSHKQLMSQKKSKNPIRNLVALRLNPQTEKELLLLEQINNQNYTQKKFLQNLNCNDLLYESEEETFMEFVESELHSLRKLERLEIQFQYQLENLQHINSINVRDLNPEEIQKQKEHRQKKAQLILDRLHQTLQTEVDSCKKLETQNNKDNEQIAQLIFFLEKSKAQLEQLEAKEKQKDDERFIFEKNLEEREEKINLDKLENIIIKMQFGESSLFRYGSRLVQSEYDKWAFSEGKAMKWPYSVDITEILDIKIFAISMLIPMARFIFNDFSSQAKVYKLLFGFHHRMSEDEVNSCVTMIMKRIEKHFMQKKMPNLAECIKNTVSIKKKKLIFICKEDAFDEIMIELLKEIKNFSNRLMCIFSIKLEMTESLYQNTSFRMGKIHIDYVFDKVSVNTVIDVLFCPFDKIMAGDVVTVRKKMLKFEPVFWWFDIPKGIHFERIEEIKRVHEALRKMKIQHS